MGLNASTMCHEARCIDKKSPCNTKSKPQMKQARHIVPVKPKLAVQLHRVFTSAEFCGTCTLASILIVYSSSALQHCSGISDHMKAMSDKDGVPHGNCTHWSQPSILQLRHATTSTAMQMLWDCAAWLLKPAELRKPSLVA